MSGNVWEWCEDWNGIYPVGPVSDPTGAGTGMDRVIRGGSWSSNVRYSRSAGRMGSVQFISFSALGFRLVLPPSQ